jgi:hypothetical protein
MLLAQPIETGLLYEMTAGTDSGQEDYADAMIGLTLLNQKKFDQTKSRKPLAVLATVTHIKRQYSTEGTPAVYLPQSSLVEVSSLANNWMVRNAVTKLGHSWRQQIKHAGLTLKDLPRYGREMNFWMDSGHKNAAAAGRDLTPYSADISDVVADDGTIFAWIPAAGEQALFDRFKIEVPATTPTGDPTEWEVYVSGAASGHVDGGGVLLNHYIRSRRSVEEEEDEEELGTSQTPASYFTQIDSVYNDATDDMLATYSSYGDNRPYSYDPDVIQMRASLDSVIPSVSIVAPLGLIKFSRFTSGDKVLVNVDAIIEM